jgi:hypothetical protein
MIVQVTGRLWGEDGILIIDDQTHDLLTRSEELPTDVVLKVYLTVVRQKKRKGEFVSTRDRMVYEWEILGPPRPTRRKKARRGWRSLVFA